MSWLGRASLCLLGVWLFGARAEAQRSVLRRPALHWVRGPGADACIDPRALSLAIEELVGPVLVRPAEAEHAVEGYVEVLASGRLRIRVRVLDTGGTAVGERVLEHSATPCAAISPAIAFVIAMMIDPGVAAHGLPPALLTLLADEPSDQALLQELDRDASEAVEAAERAPVKTAKRPRTKTKLEHELGPDKVVREPSTVQLGALVRLGLREAPRPLWSGELRALFDLSGPFALAAQLRAGRQAADYVFAPEGSLRLATFAGGVLLCAGHEAAASVRLHLCAGAEPSLVRARIANGGESFGTLRADFGLVAQLTIRVRVYGRWGALGLLSGRFSLAERKFTYTDEGDENRLAYAMNRDNVAFSLGPTYEF